MINREYSYPLFMHTRHYFVGITDFFCLRTVNENTPSEHVLYFASNTRRNRKFSTSVISGGFEWDERTLYSDFVTLEFFSDANYICIKMCSFKNKIQMLFSARLVQCTH